MSAFWAVLSVASPLALGMSASVLAQSELKYSIVVTPTTDYGFDGVSCTQASGVITMGHKKLYGKIVNAKGISYQIKGKAKGGGIIKGTAFDTGTAVAKFTGKFDDIQGTGSWNDQSNCRGSWLAKIVDA